MTFSISGRTTLTTTSLPSASRAAWTWAIDADASGSRTNSLKISSTGRPSALCTIAAAVSPGNGGTRSWRLANSSAMSSGSRSRRVEEDLAELDEDRTEILQRAAQPHRAWRLRPADPVPGQDIEDETHRTQQVRPQHDLVEAVPHQHHVDVGEPQDLAEADHGRWAGRRSSRAIRASRRSTSSRMASTAFEKRSTSSAAGVAAALVAQVLRHVREQRGARRAHPVADPAQATRELVGRNVADALCQRLLDVDIHPGEDPLQPCRQRDVAAQAHLPAQDQPLPVVDEREARKRQRGAANRDVGVDRLLTRPDADPLAVEVQAQRADAGHVEVDDTARQTGQGVARFGVQLERGVDQPAEQADGGGVHNRYPL